jgi:DNA (cytosine-5)-methyltransferase 1
MIATTERQKKICLLLLRNRRKKVFGPLDGNPLSLEQFKQLDKTIEEYEIEELVSLGILQKEKYAFLVLHESGELNTDAEKIVMSKHEDSIILADNLVCDRDIKTKKIRVRETLNTLEEKGYIECCELRYDFQNTKISTGLFGINRIFLPTSNIFPTLVASDSNDYITPVSIIAQNADDYRRDFMTHVLEKKQYRKISQTEALRIQGFPENFSLPESRSRWMKLIGNSVAVPVIEQLVKAIVNTGVFSTQAAVPLQKPLPTVTKTRATSKNNRHISSSEIEPNYHQLSLFEIAK